MDIQSDSFVLVRDVAQPGRALGLGPRRRRFKSCRPDQPFVGCLCSQFFPSVFRYRCGSPLKSAQSEATHPVGLPQQRLFDSHCLIPAEISPRKPSDKRTSPPTFYRLGNRFGSMRLPFRKITQNSESSRLTPRAATSTKNLTQRIRKTIAGTRRHPTLIRSMAGRLGSISVA